MGTATATGTINDNDPTPVVSINSASQNEGNSGTANQAFTISLSTASGRTSSVSYVTQSGTATSGSDFTSTSGSVTFAAGETTKTVNVPVMGDVTVETNETYTVRLFGASNLSYAASRNGTGTIVNDDSGPVVSVNNVTKVEGNSGTANAVFTVSLSQSSAQTVTVRYATADGTATAGSDYTTTSGTLTFTAGQTTKTVNVPVKGDTTNEADETFSLTLNTPVNATVGSAGTGNDHERRRRALVEHRGRHRRPRATAGARPRRSRSPWGRRAGRPSPSTGRPPPAPHRPARTTSPRAAPSASPLARPSKTIVSLRPRRHDRRGERDVHRWTSRTRST